MNKDAKRLLERVASLEKEADEKDLQIKRLEEEAESTAAEYQALEDDNDELKDRVDSVVSLLEQAKEHIPEIAVYGIDHRRIEEVLRG